MVATLSSSSPKITWPLLPDDFILPDDPVENQDHPTLAAALTDAIAARPDRCTDALITSNFALCAGIGDRTICKAPDWMYVRPVNPSPQPRRSYTPHTEGAVPLVVMEFISATEGGEYSMESGRKIGKWFFYERVIQVPYYVIFEPQAGEMEVYNLQGSLYRKMEANEQGRYWIEGLDLFLGVWQGKHLLRTGYWLCWWDREGERLLWQEERASQAEERASQAEERASQAEIALAQERQRKQQLLDRLQAAGLLEEE